MDSGSQAVLNAREQSEASGEAVRLENDMLADIEDANGSESEGEQSPAKVQKVQVAESKTYESRDDDVGLGVTEVSEDIRVADQFEMEFVLGMTGSEQRLLIDGLEPFASVLEELRNVYKCKEDTSVQLCSAAGRIVTSMLELCKLYGDGEKAYGTFFKDIDRMSLADIVEELKCDDTLFKGHAFTLSKFPKASTTRSIADYFWENQLLLTSDQMQSVFDQLLPKLTGDGRDMRRTLITVLHSFCLQQHHIWEPNDGSSECNWANMAWNGTHMELSSRRLTRGSLRSWGHADAVDPTAVDNWPSCDVANLRGVAKAFRSEDAQPLPR